MKIFSDNEMQVIENWLVHGRFVLSADEKKEQSDALAQIRLKYKCDNHTLHKMYSEQKKVGVNNET